jgi:hypothetical protein
VSLAYYHSLAYEDPLVICLGKRLESDEAGG